MLKKYIHDLQVYKNDLYKNLNYAKLIKTRKFALKNATESRKQNMKLMKTYKSKKQELQLIKESANTNDLLNNQTLTAKEKRRLTQILNI